MSLRQWLWLALLACFWGSAFVLMELALPTFSPLMIVLGRMGVAAVMLNLVILRQGRRWPQQRRLWVQCAGLSILNNLLPFGLVVWAQQHISASLASILIAAAPIFTVVLAVFIVGEQLTLTRGLGVLLGFSGVIVLTGPSVLQGFSLQGVGELAILGAALSYALAGFWGRRFKAIPAQLVSTMTVTMGAVIMVPLTLILEWPLSVEWQWPAGLAVLALGIFPTALAYLIYYRLLAEAGVVKTSLVSFLVPFAALLLSAIFLHERLSLTAASGMALILAGLAVLDGRLLGKLRFKQ